MALDGKIGSGKNECANQLKQYYKSLVIDEFAFADPIKRGLAHFFSVDIDWFYNRDLKTQKIPGFDITPREALIKVGTDLMRNHIDDEIWVKSTMNAVGRSAADIVLVTDVRFVNEAIAIKNAGGILLYVDRPQNIFSNNVAASHSSETELNESMRDYLGFMNIDNSGTLQDFTDTITALSINTISPLLMKHESNNE